MFSEHAPEGVQALINTIMEGRPFNLEEAARSTAHVTFGGLGLFKK
jgi:hypothetical protein